eukprot:2559814-Pleurochrysis_carterae.AAC.1
MHAAIAAAASESHLGCLPSQSLLTKPPPAPHPKLPAATVASCMHSLSCALARPTRAQSTCKPFSSLCITAATHRLLHTPARVLQLMPFLPSATAGPVRKRPRWRPPYSRGDHRTRAISISAHRC